MIRSLVFVWAVLTASAFAQCGPPTYNCSQTGTFNAGSIATIFNATSPTTITCSGGCVNSVAHDTTINPYWLDPYIRVTDGTSACQGGAQGLSLSSSPSGGDNDNTWSLNDDYLLVVTTGGIGCILHLNLSGPVPQVINTGRPQITCSGAFSFSRVTDSRYYCRSTLTNIQQVRHRKRHNRQLHKSGRRWRGRNLSRTAATSRIWWDGMRRSQQPMLFADLAGRALN